ncbi:MAG TPA: ATP-binding protein [Ktedonobacteraceae bacterium]|nr:ATP-binding protein [Ktedonobacteraceae bacterium]
MTLQAPETLVIQADQHRLLQAVENLLSNATQHASLQSEIEIKLSQHEQADGPWACVTISNWGNPLPVGQRRALFQPFAKGPHSCGFGLGLSITQRIAQAHYGTLTAHVEANGLTHFTLTLPCHAPLSSPR